MIRMHQEREFPVRTSGRDLVNPAFAILARAYGWAAAVDTETAQFEPALRAALASNATTLLHRKRPVDVSTRRTTLSAIRQAAQDCTMAVNSGRRQ